MKSNSPDQEQLELFEIPSPCKGVCQSNPQGYCMGCFRKREERFEWNTFSNEQKGEIIRMCSARQARAKRKEP